MAVKVNLHATLRQHAGGRESVEAEGNTVGECLGNLVKQYPGLEPSIFAKNGDLSRLIEIYVNLQSAYPNELVKAVQEGDEIHITLLLSGG